MSENHPDDGRIGKEIDWSLVVLSIMRPVGEPPALEVLHEFEDESVSLDIRDEALCRGIPDLELRLQVLDLGCEMAPLDRYMDWVKKTLETAKEVGNQEKVRFDEGLLKAVKIDVQDVERESNQWIREMIALGTKSPMSEYYIFSDTDDDERVPCIELDTLESDTESSTSYMTANGENSIQNNEGLATLTVIDYGSSTVNTIDNSAQTSSTNASADSTEDFGNLIDLEASPDHPTNDKETTDSLSAILEATGITEVSEVYKLLS